MGLNKVIKCRHQFSGYNEKREIIKIFCHKTYRECDPNECDEIKGGKHVEKPENL